ncbi:MAG: NAD-dependent deacylase [Candidatus Marinimicrobia bacterium]|nr:NAD-dependent deacylase [Candidatus Neomarinimicrobiota bacterium]
MDIVPLQPADYQSIVFFTGAGMSAESGIPTYRGKGGIWTKYHWEQVACEEAFRRDPEKVLTFHRERRLEVAACRPNSGHRIIAALEQQHPRVTVVTQNIDGLHGLAGSGRVIELHGSLWRLRCPRDGQRLEIKPGNDYPDRCECGAWLRPDIVWFGDNLDQDVINLAMESLAECDLFVSVGTSGTVWPAAGLPQIARRNGAYSLEINPEASENSRLYDQAYRAPATQVLPRLFPSVTGPVRA